MSSEPGIADVCVSGWTAHRFEIPLTGAMLSQAGGGVIYVYGVSPIGLANNLLDGSGQSHFPAAPLTQPVTQPTLAPTSSDANFVASLPRVPIFRFYLNGDHIFSQSASEGSNSGYTSESQAFTLVGASADARVKSIYRCFHHTTGFHLSTTSAAEAAAGGFTIEYILGYVL